MLIHQFPLDILHALIYYIIILSFPLFFAHCTLKKMLGFDCNFLKTRYINQLWKSVLIAVWMCLIIVKYFFKNFLFYFRYVMFHKPWHWSHSSAVKMKLVVFLNMNVNFKCIWMVPPGRDLYTIGRHSSTEEVAFFGGKKTKKTTTENGSWYVISE